MDWGSLNSAVMSAFAETVAVQWLDSPRTDNGIFESRHYVDEGEGEVGVSTRRTSLSVKVNASHPYATEERLIVRDVQYKITDIRDDEGGMVALDLEVDPDA
jgi:hypothetical protein